MTAFATGRALARAAQAAVPRAGAGYTVLAYHLIGGDTRTAVDVDFDRFRRDMEWLAASSLAVSLDRAVDALSSPNDASRGVVVTFDDAFDNFGRVAWPVLESLGIPVTLYVPVGFFDGKAPSPLTGASRLQPMSWQSLRGIATNPLLTVGSHSYAHADATSQSDEDLRQDSLDSKRRLEDELGQEVVHYCYPRALWNRRTRSAIAAVFRTAVVAGGRVNRASTFDPYAIRRVPLRSDMPTLERLSGSSLWLEEAVSDLARRAKAYARTLR